MAFHTNKSRLPAAFVISRRNGALVITPARMQQFILALVLFAVALAAWLSTFDRKDELLLYAFAALLLAPAMWLLASAIRRQPIIHILNGTLEVKFGAPRLERTQISIPLDSLDVRVLADESGAPVYDEETLRKRFGSLINPLRKIEPSEKRSSLYTLQIRFSGQDEWLSVFKSQLQSEIENARIAIEDEKRAWSAGNIDEANEPAGEQV